MSHTRSKSLRMKAHTHKDSLPEGLQISAPTLISTNAQDFPDLRSISPAPSLARPRSLSRQRSSPPAGLRKNRYGPYTSSTLARTDSKLGYRPGQYGTVVSITTNDPRNRQRVRNVQSEAGYPTLHNTRSSRPGAADASGPQLKTRWTNPALVESSANVPKTKVSRWKSLSRFGRKSTAKRNYDIVHQVPIYEKKNNDSELFGRSLTQPVAGPYAIDPMVYEQQQRQQQQEQLYRQQQQQQQQQLQQQQDYQRYLESQQFHQVQQTPQIQVSDGSSVYGHNPLRMNPQQLERSMSARVNNERERVNPRRAPPHRITQLREEKPLLDVSIPKCELERYSVMFGSILQQKDADQLKRISTRTPRASSLLARRHASLKPLETNHHKSISSRGAATAVASEKPKVNQESERGVRSAGPVNPPQFSVHQPQQRTEPSTTTTKPPHGASPSLSLFPANNSPPTPPLPFRLPTPPPQPPMPPKKPTRLPPTTPPMPNRSAPANIHIPDLRPIPRQPAANPTVADTTAKTTANAAVAPKPNNIPAPTIVVAPPPESPESMTTLETASSEASYEPSNISITQFPLPAGKSLPVAMSAGPNGGNNNASMNDRTNIRSSVEYARPRLVLDPAHRESDTSMEIGIALGDPYLPIHQFSYSSSTVNSINNSVKNSFVDSNGAATNYANGHVYGLSNGGTQYPYPSAPELDLEVDLGQQPKQTPNMGGLEKTEQKQKQLPPAKAVPALVTSRTKASSPAKGTPKSPASTKIPKAVTGASPAVAGATVKPLTVHKAGDGGLGMEMGMGMEQSLQKGLGLGMTMGSGMEKPANGVSAATAGATPVAKAAKPRVAKAASRAATTKLVNNLNTTTTVVGGNGAAVKSASVKGRNMAPGTMMMKQKKPLPPIGARIMVTASP